MTDISNWKVRPLAIRQPDPRLLGGKRIDGKPLKGMDHLFPRKPK